MSVLSEAAHADTAKELKEMLIDAAKGIDWSDYRSSVRAFARKHLLPKYISHCDESYGMENVDKEVLALYQ